MVRGVTTTTEGMGTVTALEQQLGSEVTTSNWRRAVPLLAGAKVRLRELRTEDAAPLLAMLTTEEVARFISPPPTTVEAFERFIEWTHRRRAAGDYVCFAVVPAGTDSAIGIFQIRQLDPSFMTAEWGFALGSAYWGTGIFMEAARLVLDFAFESVGVHRMEARAAVANGRGNGALAKIGAVREGVLRKSFRKDGQYLDQALWSILREDWLAKAVWSVTARIH
jgi:RimJ/RimL family protein N-acetyltransferase